MHARLLRATVTVVLERYGHSAVLVARTAAFVYGVHIAQNHLDSRNDTQLLRNSLNFQPGARAASCEVAFSQHICS
jgi:hypothetical protein